MSYGSRARTSGFAVPVVAILMTSGAEEADLARAYRGSDCEGCGFDSLTILTGPALTVAESA